MGVLRRKRIYEPATSEDGYRVLVDRLWPRGESRERAALDEWLKEIAPSPELRRWWNHDASEMAEFARRYRAELDAAPDPVQHLVHLVRAHPVVTVLYGAHDTTINHAAVLQTYLRDRFDIEVDG